MKSHLVKLFVLSGVFVLFFLAFMVFDARFDTEVVKVENNTQIEKEDSTNTQGSKEVVDSVMGNIESADPAEMQACLILSLGPETILKIQSGQMVINSDIEEKIAECANKTAN